MLLRWMRPCCRRSVAANLNLIFVLVVRRLFLRIVFASIVNVSCSVRIRRHIFCVSGWFFVLLVLVCVRLRPRFRVRLRPYFVGLGHAIPNRHTDNVRKLGYIGYLQLLGASIRRSKILRFVTMNIALALRKAKLTSEKANLNYAVLIDADQWQHSKMSLVLAELAAMGVNTTVRRAYGDFTRRNVLKDACLKHSIIPVQADTFISGKASTDFVLMEDAMNLFSMEPNLDGFVIVSSDSDFFEVAKFLRGGGKHVIGVGGQPGARHHLYYDRFIILNTL